MELREINTFLIAAEKSNFSKAAEHLGYSQAAISIQIKQLEKELGTPLFDRIGKSVYLTEKGKEFVIYAQKIIRYTEESISYMRDKTTHSGILRVGTSESILSSSFLGIINEFHHLHPDIHIMVKTGIREYIFNEMSHNELDLAYVIDQNIIDSKWIGRTIQKDKVYFVASANNSLTKKDNVTIQEILKQDLVLTECDVGYSYALVQALAKNSLYIQPYLESGNTDLLKKLVIKNRGISYLPLFILEKEIQEKTIIPIRIPEYEMWVYRQLFWHKNKNITQPMADFMGLIDSHVK